MYKLWLYLFSNYTNLNCIEKILWNLFSIQKHNFYSNLYNKNSKG